MLRLSNVRLYLKENDVLRPLRQNIRALTKNKFVKRLRQNHYFALSDQQTAVNGSRNVSPVVFIIVKTFGRK